MWKMINYESCGQSHIKQNVPCQDKTYVSCENNVQTIALADGAGSARYSHFGAETTVKAISKYIAHNFEKLINKENGLDVKEIIISVIVNSLKEKAVNLNCDLKDLASTLLFVAVKDDKFMIVHLGDGVVGYIKDDDLKVASTPENGEYANATYFTTSYRAISKIKLFKGKLNNISGFVLLSDGSADSFYHKASKTLSDSLKRVIKWTGILSYEKMYSMLSSSFDEIVIKNTQDDCSIAVMTLVSDKNDYLFSLTDKEKYNLLGLNHNNIKKVERLCKILQYLDKPKSISVIGREIHIKPKYTGRHMDILLERGLIVKKGCMYHRV